MSNDRTTVPYAFVVDDDAMILMHALDILEDAGFRTLSSGNGDDALAALEAHDDEVVLLFTDVKMPGSMDGFGLARCRREVARHRHPGGLGTCEGRGGRHAGRRGVRRQPFSDDVIYDPIHVLLPDGKKPEPLKRKNK